MMLRIILRPLAACEGVRVRDVHAAQTPKDALALLSKLPQGPLAVVSDFNLKADMNGHDLLAHVKRERPDALRILMSGYSREQIGPLVDAEHIDGFVEKALRLNDTVAPVCRLMRAHFTAEA